MSIHDKVAAFKSRLEARLWQGVTRLGSLGGMPRDILIVAILILASTASFGLGYLAGRDAGARAAGVSIEVVPAGTAGGAAAPANGRYVASRSGTKYYLPGCTGAGRISDANKVWFATAAAAKAEGYTPAADCPGL